MTQRQFNTAYKRAIEKNELEKMKKQQPGRKTSIDKLLKLMEVKGQMGAFQSFNPRDFGADYDIVPVPKDNTTEAEFWFSNNNT